jgi:DNA-binding NtrC family response regulator
MESEHLFWMVLDIESATVALEKYEISIVMCESHLLTDTWRDVLSRISVLNDPPLLIVTSRLADERLWAEALNTGAFDVLAKPFDTGEVMRTMTLAWQHWQERHGLHHRRTKQRKHDHNIESGPS